MSQEPVVTVGNIKISLAEATAWVKTYTDETNNKSKKKPYAYPAYDRYEQDTNDPHHLSDADLLAPVLLNVSISIRSFYALQAVRRQLEDELQHPALNRSLIELADDEVRDAVGPLYAVLDEERPPGVGGTKLSKILHRKAPQCLVLHDRWVRACYLGGDLVPFASKRSWAEYMTLITKAIQRDLLTQPDVFEELSSIGTGLSHVRILDILAWSSRGQSPA